MAERKIYELSLDELNSIAGGRRFYEEEWDNYYDASVSLTKKLRRMKLDGKEQEVAEIRKACSDLFDQWMADVGNSPDGSAPIYFRNYIQQYLDD